MQQTHPSTEQIERYALNASSLSPVEIEKLRHHFAKCLDCLETYERITAFYESALDINENSFVGETAQFISILRQENKSQQTKVIELFPRIKQSHFENERPTGIALAALDADTQPHYTTVETLASIDEKVLLRIVRDNKEKRYILQVHSDDPSHHAYVLVSFNKIPGTYLTDETGETIIPDIGEALPQHLRALVHPSEDSFEVRSLDIKTLRSTGSANLNGKYGGTLRIELMDDRAELVYTGKYQLMHSTYPKIAYLGKQGMVWSQGKDEHSEIPKNDALEMLLIKVY